MYILIPIIAAAAYKVGCKLVQDQQRAKTHTCSVATQPSWTSTIECSHTPQEACGLIARFLTENGAVLKQRSDTLTLYGRGDQSITKLPINRDVSWREIPVWIGLGHGEIGDNGKTLIHVDFRAFSTTAYSDRAAVQFRDLAQKEFKRIIAHLNASSEPQPNSEQTAPTQDSKLRIDLEILGLMLGVSWEQVQAAYRELSRKYHPDSLSGQSIDPHLIELAEQRFKEIAAAYQRLRNRMSRRAS